MSDTKSNNQNGLPSLSERFAQIAKNIGFSEVEVAELQSTYQFALEEDMRPKTAKIVPLLKARAVA